MCTRGLTGAVKLIFIVLGIFTLWHCGEDREEFQVELSSITESVYSSITVQPDSLYLAYAAVGGILDKNLVEEGSTVAQGDPIAQIINSTPNLNRENARLALQLARQNYEGNNALLKSLSEQIEAARLQYTNDSVNFLRQKSLWAQGIGSKAEFDNRQLAFELARNNLRLKISAFAQTEHELNTKYKQAQNNFQSSSIAARDFIVHSKIDGMVYALYKNPGELVTNMEPVAAVGSATDFLIEMLVDEVDIVKLSPGQKTLVVLDAYPARVFEAQVSKIYPKKDERSQTFTVEALFSSPPARLYPGLSGEGNIIIDHRDDALVIPREYLVNDSLVETKKGWVKVITGLRDLDQIEIVSGIQAGTVLLKPTK
jgi:RND family efflux transporter MFP subunit